MLPLPVFLLVACLIGSLSVFAAPHLPPLNAQPTGLALPGKFTWFDLATPAIESQKEFYRNVFGWSFRSPGQSDDKYILVINNGRSIAGMFSFEPPQGAQDGATWITLMAVDDPAQAVQTVKAKGGSVEIPPTQVSARGRHALFRDPAGALFGVLHSDSGDPPDHEAGIGDFLWVDLFTRDVEQMTRFYQALAPFETKIQPVADDITRTLLYAHGMPRAGIVPADEEANRASWVPYVRVNDVAETLEKVVAGGGFAIIPPDERLLDGNLALFVDPHGGVTGIVKWEYAKEGEQ